MIGTRHFRSYSSSRIGAYYWGYYTLYDYQAGLYSCRSSYPNGERFSRKGTSLKERIRSEPACCQVGIMPIIWRNTGITSIGLGMPLN